MPPALCLDFAAETAAATEKHAIFSLYNRSITPHSQSMTQFDLRQQDCIEGMLRLANESVDLVVTSPPYNLGIGYRQYADRQDRQSYLNWCAKWAAQIRRILRSNGSFFLNVGSAPSNPMLPHQIVIELTSASGGFLLQNTIHWIKSITIDTKRSHPHLNPLPGQARGGREAPGEGRSSGKNFWSFQANQFEAVS